MKLFQKRALKAEKQRDDALDKITEQRKEICRLSIELEEEKGRCQKLTAQLNHNYENSSIPSSMTIKKKKYQTAVKRPEGNREPRWDIKDTDERNRPQHRQ